MRTGILGGTFNPPHLGHLHAACLAREALGLDKVLFIPTNKTKVSLSFESHLLSIL